jgi:hypothetical protein
VDVAALRVDQARRLDGVTWRPILAGAILAVPLTLLIGVLASLFVGWWL